VTNTPTTRAPRIDRSTPSRTRSGARGTGPSYVGSHTANVGGNPRQRRSNVGGTYGTSGFHRPYYHHATRRYCGFYYPRPVTRCYVPFGFYGGSRTIYIDTADGVSDDYIIQEYETTAPPLSADEDIMQAAAGSAAAERYMREATELFGAGDYSEAARRFRLAAIAAPDESGPLFAMGQSLIALKNYPASTGTARSSIA